MSRVAHTTGAYVNKNLHYNNGEDEVKQKQLLSRSSIILLAVEEVGRH